jgi:hypothetical protein
MKSSVEISNQILFEQYSIEIECFKKYHKNYGINTHMLFHRILDNNNRSLMSYLQKQFHCYIDYVNITTQNYFQVYKCIIVGLAIAVDDTYYILEITNTLKNEVLVVSCPMKYVGKGNKINWKKGV